MCSAIQSDVKRGPCGARGWVHRVGRRAETAFRNPAKWCSPPNLCNPDTGRPGKRGLSLFLPSIERRLS